MKNNQFTGVLIFLLLISTLSAAYLILKWNSYYHRQVEAQVRLMDMKNSTLVMQQLLNETAESAKASNSKDLLAIVQQFSTPHPPAAPVKPAGGR